MPPCCLLVIVILFHSAYLSAHWLVAAREHRAAPPPMELRAALRAGDADLLAAAEQVPQRPCGQLVDWSARGLLAFTWGPGDLPIRLLEFQHALADALLLFRGGQHPIYIASPYLPKESHTLLGPHSGAIRILRWAPAAQGSLLLSADESVVCIWRQGGTLSQWSLVQSFQAPGLVAAAWLSAEEQDVTSSLLSCFSKNP